MGALIHADDDAAIRALAALDEGVPVELWCQQRKPRLLAIKAGDGSLERVENP